MRVAFTIDGGTVSDADRLRVELTDDSRVVRDHVIDPVARYAVGLLPGFLHRGRVARPARRHRRVAPATIWQAQGSLVETPDLVLLERLREVLANQPVTETELRGLIEQADGLVRTLGAHMAGSERRLTELTADPDSSLAEIAVELHRVDGLRPRLDEARTLLRDLEARARELRTSWLIRQAEDPLTR